MTINEFQAYDLYKYYPDIDNDRYYNYRVKKKNKLVRGAKYMLKGLECDGFGMPTRVYQVVALVKDVNDVVLNSVVMRQLQGNSDDTKFTLSRAECQVLHIKYEPGLQLFPAGMMWKKWSDKIETGRTVFNEADMSTYPVSRIDGNIRHVIIKIDRFRVDGSNVIDSVTDKEIPIDTFLSSMRLTSKGNIVSLKDAYSHGLQFFKKDESIPYRIIMPGDNGLEDDDTSTDSMFIEAYLKKPSRGIHTDDGISGIPPTLLKGKTVNDMFNIYVDEFKLNKKNHKSAIKHYEKKTGDTFKLPGDSFVARADGTYNIITTSDMHRHGHVGDIIYDASNKSMGIKMSNGLWMLEE